jgi:hypothetical protein
VTNALFRLAFTVAPAFTALTCHYLWVAGSFFNRHEVRRFSRPPTACKFMVSCSFHSPPGVLFTFPSRYCFTIGHSGIFSLTRWSSQIHTGFHVPHATWDSVWLFQFSSTRLSLSMVKYSKLVPLIVCISFFNCPSTLNFYIKFRLFPFRSPLLRESFLLSFPLGTKMFQFPRFALTYLWIQ